MPKNDPKDSPSDVNLETHPLVAKLHADPDELTNLVALVGYLGPSKRAGSVRLYLDLTFRNYYEILTEGIVSTSPAAAGDENSPTTVHVTGSTQVDKVSVTSQSTEARFLQGSIASGYLAGAGVGEGLGCSWPTSPSCWCRTSYHCQPGGAQVGALSMNITQNGCEQQGGNTFMCSVVDYTCDFCRQAGAQANAQAYWPVSPTCWGCNHTSQGCS